MERREFGNSGVESSVVAFGTWALGSDWWGETDQPQDLVNTALELGITTFETGDVYGQGSNEEIIAQALKQSGKPRDSYELSTKFGYVIGEGRQAKGDSERPQDFSPEHTKVALEASLKRLNTDYVDLYQLHNPRMSAIESDELFAQLESLKSEGKIRSYGVALGPAIGWREEGLKALEDRAIDALQTVYNMLEREPGDEFLKVAEQQGSQAGIIARVPTASGLLEDKFTAGMTFSGNDHRRYRPKEWLIEGLKKVEGYRFLTEEGNRTLAQAALQFVLAQPGITCVAPTVTTVAELKEWGQVSELTALSQQQLAAINRRYEESFARVIGGELRSSN